MKINEEQEYRIKIHFNSPLYEIVQGDIKLVGHLLYSIFNHRNTIIQETMIFNDKIISLEFFKLKYIEDENHIYMNLHDTELEIPMEDKEIENLIDKSMDLYVKELKKESVVDNE